MAFDDLDDAASEQQDRDREEHDDPIEEPSTMQETTTGTPSTEELSDPLTEPAFEFDESVQVQFYPREETFEAFEDALDIDVKRRLRERGVRNESGRELHEAVLQVAMENPDLVAAKLEELREE